MKRSAKSFLIVAILVATIFLSTPADAQGAYGNWSAVAQCESHGNPAINTGNGYYGLVQFSYSTWANVANMMGRPDLAAIYPHQASAWDQIAVADYLAFSAPGGGLHHWPICGAYYGGCYQGVCATAAPAPAPEPTVAPAVVAPAPTAVPVAPVPTAVPEVLATEVFQPTAIPTATPEPTPTTAPTSTPTPSPSPTAEVIESVPAPVLYAAENLPTVDDTSSKKFVASMLITALGFIVLWLAGRAITIWRR
ncbi:MAG: transglycosylase family protein [Caldilineaceae bacterium]|nr:transglycosylase family protein [Caldilineaceae bacterium]